MKYLIEIFNKETGRRYHYNHIDGDLLAAVNEFNQTDESTFSAENATIITLTEISGHRNGCFNEGASLVSKTRILLVKGVDFQPNQLCTFVIKETINNMNTPVTYLRVVR